MSRPNAVDRMRSDIAEHFKDRVRVERDASDPDTWGVDSETGLLTRPDLELVWEGPATIQAPDQTRSREEVDRIVVKVPADVDIKRHDLVTILQSPKDYPMLKHGRWYIIDVDYGTHHVSRRIVAARRERFPVERYGSTVDER